MAKNDDPLEKPLRESRKKRTCDFCSYTPKNYIDYILHLKSAHPENGDPTK